ncbi:MAG: Hsp20/alpha crystallin family protein [Anaerolineales bacterium]|nr:Hsp20/alpha crystallin family protein [Anaerolineales bacterium]
MAALTLKTSSERNEWPRPEDPPSFTVDDLRWRLLHRPRLWRPPTDVFETEDVLIVRVEIAGMRDADFTISLEDRRLLISGNRPDLSERRAYHQMEIPFGEFSTEVELSTPVVPEKVDAVYRDGFLKITLPKAKPRQIIIGE